MIPDMGYMPGQLRWHFGERHQASGVTILNAEPDDATHKDRRLITGASPLAACQPDERGDYSAALHYLRAVQAAGTDEPKAVAAAMRALPINDITLSNGKIRCDGRVERDMYLFKVKRPDESRSNWDLYELVATVPFKEAFRLLAEGGCKQPG